MKNRSGKAFAQRIRSQKIYYFILLVLVICGISTVFCLMMHNTDQRAAEAVPVIGAAVGEIAGETESAGNPLKDYADIIVSVITAVIVALLSITVTVFVFLKSALDRIIDENRYISNVANIYKSESAAQLSGLCAAGFFTLAISIGFHWLITFHTDQQTFPLTAALVSLGIMLLCNLLISVLFWSKCIRVEDSLQCIIFDECQRLKEELTDQTFMKQRRNCLMLIGDWDQWETERMSSAALERCGWRLCKKMTAEQFINLFLRTEILLLSGERGYGKNSISDSDIFTVLQERDNILNPNARVGNQDLKGRRYLSSRPDSRQICDYMTEFEQRVGYFQGQDGEDKAFFNNTRDLYKILKQYRDLLISRNFTLEKGRSGQRRSSCREQRHSPDSSDNLAVFAQGLYYFFLRTMAVFVSALHISNFSFNGFTLNFANFYSSILENVSLYSSEFYHTIFARTQLLRTTMDVSRFDSIDLYNTSFISSTLNNAELVRVCFDSAQLVRTGLSSCTFEDCRISDSDFEECVLTGSTFTSCCISSTNFHGSKMRGIVWEAGTEIRSCKFIGADIQKWEWPGGAAELLDCDFSRSTWNSLEIKKGDLRDCDFSSAELIKAKFEDTNLSAVLFAQAVLTGGKFVRCQMVRTSLEMAALFQAEFIKAEIPQSNLIQVSAVGASFQGCDLSESDCSEADFSNGTFTDTKFFAARLYDCSFTKASFSNCCCDYILADHLQLTFATCTAVTFRKSSLSDSNLAESSFTDCDFQGSNLTSLNATKVEFSDCGLNRVDFSETRFIESCFRAADSRRSTIKGSIFSCCKFESVLFDGVTFKDCIFTDALFIHCRIIDETGKTHLLTKADFEQGSSYAGNQIDECVFVR